jgi:uncharacterized protein (TIGR03083 family)
MADLGVASSTATELSDAARSKASAIFEALREDGSLEGPSNLPGWSRLTVVCHLRYGARALRWMTTDALAGRTTSFYPGGRTNQRPATLQPEDGEEPSAVLASLFMESENLHDQWAQLGMHEWAAAVREPDANPDLGSTTLGFLTMMRLTEVEVHASDLGIGLDTWNEVFVSNSLPLRIEWLARRRSNHRKIDPGIQGSWKLVATEGRCWVVSVEGPTVTSRATDEAESADAQIAGTSRDLLAMLLGRPLVGRLDLSGDVELARAFSRAFPGP